MASKFVLSIFLCFLVTLSVAERQQTATRRSEGRQCQLQSLRSSQPSQRIQSEGGVTEFWDENEDQFQCVGVAAMKNTIQPNSLSLPSFHSTPRLIYIEQGSGLMGLNFPGCAETFHSQSESWRPEQREKRERETEQGHGRRQGQGQEEDQHQKVQRIRQGDIIAVPAGVSHWCYNDGNQDLVAVIVNDVNNEDNQLDQRSRHFFLAGSVQKQGRQGSHGRTQDTFKNILAAFDEELMAESFNMPRETIRKMQREDERGLIVKVQGDSMRVIRPREEDERQQGGKRHNGLEETWCTMKNRVNIDKREDAEIFEKRAGRINVANQHTLPLLQRIDMSAEKGTLYPKAIYTPNWSMSGHSVIYVLRGDAQVQMVGNNGEKIFDDNVNQGDMFVVPQFFTSMIKAGSNGFEWVSMKTTSQPLKNPLVGYTSVMRAMPLQVLTNAYQIETSEARQLKNNRGGQTFLLSPMEEGSN